ncbi:MAG: hypothetical protein V1857_05235 [archaeon]
MNKRAPSFDEYLAAGFLANSPLLFFTYAIKTIWPDSVPWSLEVLSSLVVVLGGAMASYLIARKTGTNSFQIGLKTAVSASLVNFVFSSIVVGEVSPLYGLWILVLFCSAGMLGLYLRRAARAKGVAKDEGKPS